MALDFIGTCENTVSLLRALTLGAGEACVSIGLPSVLTAVGGFVVGVVVLQYVARKFLVNRKVIKEPKAKTGPFDVHYDGGPVKTKRFWRS